jgi:hypothetical protein
MSFIYKHQYFQIEFRKNQYFFSSRLTKGKNTHPIILEQLEMQQFITQLGKKSTSVQKLFSLPESNGRCGPRRQQAIMKKIAFKISSLVHVEATTCDGVKIRLHLKYMRQRICCNGINTTELYNFYHDCNTSSLYAL